MRRADWLEKTLMLGKIEGRRRRGRQSTRWLDGITNSMDMSLSMLGDDEGQGSLAWCSPWGRKESDMTEGLNNNNLLPTQKQYWNSPLCKSIISLFSSRQVSSTYMVTWWNNYSKKYLSTSVFFPNIHLIGSFLQQNFSKWLSLISASRFSLLIFSQIIPRRCLSQTLQQNCFCHDTYWPPQS